MGHKFVFIFLRCGLLRLQPLHLIILSASPSSLFKQSSRIGVRTKIVNKDSIRTAIELGSPVSESLIKISKFHGPTDSEHKFHEARIKNWSPMEFKLGFP